MSQNSGVKPVITKKISNITQFYLRHSPALKPVLQPMTRLHAVCVFGLQRMACPTKLARITNLPRLTSLACVACLVVLFFTNSEAQARQNIMSGGTSAPAATSAAPTTTQTAAPTATTTGATAGTPAATPTTGTAPGTASTKSSVAGEGNILINASVAPAAALSTTAATAAPGFGYGNFRPGTEQITEGPIDD